MGYKVVANNPGLNMHPFLRSWIADEQVLVFGRVRTVHCDRHASATKINPCLLSADMSAARVMSDMQNANCYAITPNTFIIAVMS